MTIRDADTLKSYFALSKVPVPSQYDDLIDTIFSMSGGGGGGLHDDRYVKIALQDTITIAHIFNPTVAGPPFSLGANAQYRTVIGFKADQLAKSVIAGNGLTDGGVLTADVTLNIGQGDGITVSANSIALTTPGTLSVSTSNSSTGSHTHAITTSSNPSGASILASDADITLTLTKLKIDTLADKSGGNLTISPTGDITLDPSGNDILPFTNYELNLGLISKKFLTLHAAELWVETLVAQEVIATIGGHILVAPTTILTSDVSSVQTNLCLNPGFSTSGTGGGDVFENWVENAGTGSIVKDGTIYYDGLASCKLTPGIGANTYVYQQFNVTAGEGYSFNFYTRGTGTLAGRYGVYDATHSTWIIALTSTGVTAATWTKVSNITFEIPTGCSVISIYLYCAASGTTACHFDALTLYKDFITVKHENLGKGDFIYLQTAPSGVAQIEWMQVLSSSFGTGPYTYYVLRDLDGTGTNNWYAGDAVLNTGGQWDGFIDLYSISSIRAGTQYGPTIQGVVRWGTTYAATGETWAIGNLNGLYGYGVDTYGVGLGFYGWSYNHVTLDPTNGMRFGRLDGTGVYHQMARWYADGTILIGEVGSNLDNIYITSGAIEIRNNTTKRIEMTSAGIMYIRDSSGNAVFTFDASAGAEITKKLTMPGTSSAIAIGATPPTSATSGTGIWLDRTGLYNLVSSVQNFKIDASSGALYIGAYDISQYPIKADAQGFLFKTYGAGDNYQCHIEFGSDHSTGLKGQIYYYYSGAGVFNIMQIIANPSSNTSGSLYLHGYDILLEGGTGGVTLTAGTGGFKCGPGITIGDDTTAPPSQTIQQLDKNSHPTYYSSGEQYYGMAGALTQQNVNNRRFNLTGGGGALALLAPLTFPSPRAVWLTGTGSDYDFTRYHTPLTPNSMANSTYKAPITPAPLYICDFNGSSSYLSADLTTYAHLNVVNWFSFGAWIYIDATGRNHAVGAMGSTTNAWYLIWYNAGGYWEFGYVDTGGTQRRVQRTATLTTGWHFVGFEHGWTASGNNHTLVRYDNTTTALDNQAWLGMRSGAGYLTLGNYSSYLLDGKMATAWISGYMPASVGDCLAEYYNLTQGLFK